MIALAERLEAIAESDYFEADALDITDELEAEEAGAEALEPILRFMETHPDVDFGVPGSLVNFVEKQDLAVYEGALLESIQRQPTHHTLWMLHRIINGEQSPEKKSRLMSIYVKAGGDWE